MGDTPQTVMTTRAPAVLTKLTKQKLNKGIKSDSDQEQATQL